MKEGSIINSNLSEKEIKEIKANNQDYINITKLFILDSFFLFFIFEV